MTCGATADLLELVFIIKKIVLSITDKKNYMSFLNLKTNKQCRPRQYKSLAWQPSKKGNPTQNSISEKRNNHYRRDVSCEGLEREQVGTKRGIQHNSHSSLMSPPMGMKPEWSVYVTMWTPLFDSSKLSPKMIFKGKYSYIISMCVCVCVSVSICTCAGSARCLCLLYAWSSCSDRWPLEGAWSSCQRDALWTGSTKQRSAGTADSHSQEFDWRTKSSSQHSLTSTKA